MPIPVKCPGCGVKLTLADDRAGTMMECPNCEAKFPVSKPKPTILVSRAAKSEEETDEESPTPPRQKRKGGFPLWGWFAIGGGVLLLVCGGISFGGYLVFRGAVKALPQPPAQSNEESPATKVFLRADFVARCEKCRTEDDVIAAVGRPETTTDRGLGTIKVWEYRKRTKDPLSGKIDYRTVVKFDQYHTFMNVEFP